MNTPEKIILIIFTILIIPFSIGLYYVLDYYNVNFINADLSIETEPIVNNEKNTEIIEIAETDPTPKVFETPEIVKAVYATSSSAASQKYFKYLENLFENTEINTVIIDIKDFSGRNMVSAFDGLIQKLHDKGIYVIARIVVFEDPVLAKARPDLAIYDKLKTTDPKNPVLWVDNNNLSWVDPSSKEAWDYNISIAKEAVIRGFDEINFDYIRFPSDGEVENMGFPFWDKKVSMRSVIKGFFKELRSSLPEAKLSADLFGYSTVSVNDMGIGQVLEDSFEYFDYISPMIYPSHYKEGFKGYLNPAEYPYEVVKYSMQEALKRHTAYYEKLETEGTIINKTKLRPWLQDFNMGADYTADMVRGEINAVIEALEKDYCGFMLWNASNIYTTEAIK